MTFEEVLPALKGGSKVTLEYGVKTGFYYYLSGGPDKIVMMNNKNGNSIHGATTIGTDILRTDWVILD
jgi:hypothetical protein